MRKLLCALLLAALFTGTATADPHKLGFLSKLNMTEEEFQAYMDDAKASGSWMTFSTGEPHPVNVKFYDSLNAMQMGLGKGEVEEIGLPEAVGEYLLNTASGYYPTGISRTTPVYFAFGFRKSDDPTLKDRFNDALMSMKGDGTLFILQAKYIAEPGVGEPEPVEFSTFNGSDTIKVAVTGDLPPIDFIAANGTPAGFNTAVLAEIGRRLHLNIELVNIESGARAASLASGRTDVVFWFQAQRGDGVQPDVPEGIMLSESYYDWNKYLHIKKK